MGNSNAKTLRQYKVRNRFQKCVILKPMLCFPSHKPQLISLKPVRLQLLEQPIWKTEWRLFWFSLNDGFIFCSLAGWSGACPQSSISLRSRTLKCNACQRCQEIAVARSRKRGEFTFTGRRLNMRPINYVAIFLYLGPSLEFFPQNKLFEPTSLWLQILHSALWSPKHVSFADLAFWKTAVTYWRKWWHPVKACSHFPLPETLTEHSELESWMTYVL